MNFNFYDYMGKSSKYNLVFGKIILKCRLFCFYTSVNPYSKLRFFVRTIYHISEDTQEMTHFPRHKKKVRWGTNEGTKFSLRDKRLLEISEVDFIANVLILIFLFY